MEVKGGMGHCISFSLVTLVLIGVWGQTETGMKLEMTSRLVVRLNPYVTDEPPLECPQRTMEISSIDISVEPDEVN